MDIARIIQDLLYRDSSISIPGIGTLSIIYIPSEILKFSNRITPPSYRIDFKENFDASNNSLVYVLSEVYDLSIENAQEIVEKWVKDVKEILNEGKSFSLTNVGTLKDISGILIFEADPNSPLIAGSYGLESAKIPLIEIETEKPETHTSVDLSLKPKSPNKKLRWIAALVVLFILISGSLIVINLGYLDTTFSKIFVLLGLNEAPEKQQFATNDTLSGKIDANKLKRNALWYKEIQKSKNATSNEKQQILQRQNNIKYYIIAGSFKSYKSANSFKTELVMKGFTPEILNIGDTTFRVSLNSFNDRHKAIEEYIMLTTQDSSRKIWLYSQLIVE